MRTRCFAVAIGAITVLLTFTGCDTGPPMGDISGTVTVDGKTPAIGSSITFIPADGMSPSAGCTLEEGKYSAKVPVGKVKVEIRVPRPIAKPGKAVEGPGSEGGFIEESLPAKYNDQTELTYDVVRGAQTKDFALTK